MPSTAHLSSPLTADSLLSVSAHRRRRCRSPGYPRWQVVALDLLDRGLAAVALSGHHPPRRPTPVGRRRSSSPPATRRSMSCSNRAASSRRCSDQQGVPSALGSPPRVVAQGPRSDVALTIDLSCQGGADIATSPACQDRASPFRRNRDVPIGHRLKEEPTSPLHSRYVCIGKPSLPPRHVQHGKAMKEVPLMIVKVHECLLHYLSGSNGSSS